MGSLADHLDLVKTLEAYTLAQLGSDLCPSCEGQLHKAEQLYIDLTHLAFACGWAKGRQHSHMSAFEFATMRAAQVRKVFPANLAEARRRAA